MKFSRLSELLLEASSFEDYLKIIVPVVEKRIGKKLGRSGGEAGIETFENSEGTGRGVRYFVDGTSKALRFNLKGNRIHSIDVWDDISKDPAVRMETNEVTNLVKIVPLVIDQLNKPTIGEFEILSSGKLTEATEIGEIKMDGKSFTKKGDAHKYLRNEKGMTWAQAIATVDKFIENVKVNGGPSEDNIVVPPEAKKYQDEIEYADPKTIFKDLENLTKMVASKAESSPRAMLVTGSGGTGKTHTVTETLKEEGYTEGKDYDKVTGTASARGMYEKLFLNHDGFVLFDDCDGIFADKDAVNILKGALDTSKVRKISWLSAANFDTKGMSMEEIISAYNAQERIKRLPNSFEFTGKVIFISNMPPNKLDQALRTRAFSVDVTLKPEDMLERVKDILPKLMPEVSLAKKEEAFEVVEAYVKEKIAAGKKLKNEINMRSMIKSIQVRASGVGNWKDLIVKYAL